MIDLLREHQKQIEMICRRLQIRRLDVFGTAATGDFDPKESDIDFLVEFEHSESSSGLLSRYLALAEELEQLLGIKIDLITPQSIRNPYFREKVDSCREEVYAA